jgi:hypothetical protein
MERSNLDLRFSIFEGNAASINRLVLFGHLRAEADSPHQPTPKLLIMCRDDSGYPPPWITQSPITDQDVAGLVRLLCAAGFPRRLPRIATNKGSLGVSQHLALVVVVSGHRRSLDLVLEHAGFSGDDAEPLRAVLRRLGELAEAAGRPAVRAMFDDLVVGRSGFDRCVQPRDGLPLRSLIQRRVYAVDGPASLTLRADTQVGEDGSTTPSWTFLRDP